MFVSSFKAASTQPFISNEVIFAVIIDSLPVIVTYFTVCVD